MSRNGLPRRVYEKHGSYWHVAPDGKWTKLCRVREGLPTMYRALAELTDRAAGRELLPAVLARWLDARRGGWSADHARYQESVAARISKRFATLAPAQVTAKLCWDYLHPLRVKPNTHNRHRTQLIEVLSFAATEGLREGHNPATDTEPIPTKQRKRIVTDDELVAIREAALKRGAACAAVPALLDLALLTGQRIGDLIALTWERSVTDEGILLAQQKTGERLLIEWSDALRAAVEACGQAWGRSGHLLKSAHGRGFSYTGIWQQFHLARKDAGATGLHIHDLRGRAGVDALLAAGEDVRAAQRLLGHRGEAMTRRYVDGKYHKRTKPSR